MLKKSINNNKTVFITGANRGIGFGIAQYCDSQGFNLILHARREFSDDILGQFKNLINVAIFDINDTQTMTTEISRVLSTNVKIDVLVNCAGITNDSLFVNMTADEFNNVINTNFLGAVNVINRVIPKMIAQNEGAIINISSAIAEI